MRHQHTKHIDIDINYVRDKVATRQIHVLHVLSSSADIFTKRLPTPLFLNFRSSLNILSFSSNYNGTLMYIIILIYVYFIRLRYRPCMPC